MAKPPGEISPNRFEEQQLMQRIAQGDDDAFNEFDLKYRKLIYSTVYKVLANPDDSLDIMNEVMLKIWKNAGNYHSSKGSLVTWICTTARNRAIDHLRSQNRRNNLNQEVQKRYDSEKADFQISGWDEIFRKDIRDELKKELKVLPNNQKDVIEMIYFEGLTQKQAAEKLSRPIGTVKAQIKRGLEKLRSIFEARYRGDGLSLSC